jgi:polysulfide reductase-like protein
MSEPAYQSYYGRPILKEPVWTPEVPWYFFSGGMGGASSSLALGARLVGNDRLARNAELVALAAMTACPVLLMKDLGRPQRFYNMLRVFKVTSPMSVGSWLLAVEGTATGIAGSCRLFGIFRPLRGVAETVAGVFGLGLSTYTGALVADTAIPVWHEARRELPFVFAGGAAATAGAAAAIVTPPEDAGPARRLALAGAAIELAATKLMEKRLGPFLAEPYQQGESGTYARLAKGLTAAGATVLALAGRRRVGAVTGGALLLAGGAFQRWAVFRAGFASARDPKYTVVPQRERVEARG